MVTFVGAEYIIANVLIALKKSKNRSKITFRELNNLGIFIQKMSIEKCVDAVFLTSQDQMASALFDFSDYFEYSGADSSICIKRTKQIDDLASRFVGYLPWDVLSFLVETTNEFAHKAG